MEKVLITGASGLIGKRLTKQLLQAGYAVAHLGRKKSDYPGVQSFTWNIDKQEIEKGALDNCAYIVHLAGESILAKAWTATRKKAILDSRIKTAELLKLGLAAVAKKPRAIIAASAIGYYGFGPTNHVFTELDEAGNDFCALTCKKWEASVQSFDSGIRKVNIRIGIVLSKEGGALPLAALPVRLGLGAAVGSGKQIIPWIHIDDLCGIFLHAIQNSTLEGAYNAVAPHPINQLEFTRAIASQLHRPLFLPKVPAFLIQLVLGERATLILNGNSVSCNKLLASGYGFQYSVIQPALANLYAE